MAATPAAIRAQGVGKRYLTGLTQGVGRYRSLREDVAGTIRRISKHRSASADRSFWGLRDLTFEISAGERVGIIGRNGAGKSTLLKLLAEITPPSEGRVEIRGQVACLLEVGTGFHPELTGRDNVYLSGAILGMRRADINARLDEIVEFAGISAYLDSPVKRYSSGMYLRLAFAVAAHLEPDILLVDEILAVGDAEFQQKCLGRMDDIGRAGRTVLFVSHSIPAVVRLCDRVILLEKGRVVADGPTAQVVRAYVESGLGSPAERRWDDPATAPGDSVGRLKSVSVFCDGRVADEVDIRRPVEIVVEHWRLGGEQVARTVASLQFHGADGACLFASNDFTEQSWREEYPEPGIVRSTCCIPGNFLAEGEVSVLAAVCSSDPHAVHAVERDAVSFLVVDRSRGDGVRGPYAGSWPGVVRPMLPWRRVVQPDAPPPPPEPPIEVVRPRASEP